MRGERGAFPCRLHRSDLGRKLVLEHHVVLGWEPPRGSQDVCDALFLGEERVDDGCRAGDEGGLDEVGQDGEHGVKGLVFAALASHLTAWGTTINGEIQPPKILTLEFSNTRS